MAEAVVDALEMVEVEEDDADLMLIVMRLFLDLVEIAEQSAAVQNAGQRIRQCQEAQVAFRPFHDEAAGEREGDSKQEGAGHGGRAAEIRRLPIRRQNKRHCQRHAEAEEGLQHEDGHQYDARALAMDIAGGDRHGKRSGAGCRGKIVENDPVGIILVDPGQEDACKPDCRRQQRPPFHLLAVERQEAGHPGTLSEQGDGIADLDGKQVGDFAADRSQRKADAAEQKAEPPIKVGTALLVVAPGHEQNQSQRKGFGTPDGQTCSDIEHGSNPLRIGRILAEEARCLINGTDLLSAISSISASKLSAR